MYTKGEFSHVTKFCDSGHELVRALAGAPFMTCIDTDGFQKPCIAYWPECYSAYTAFLDPTGREREPSYWENGWT